MVTVYIIET